MSKKSLARRKSRRFPSKFTVREGKLCLIMGSADAVFWGVVFVVGVLSWDLKALELLICMIFFLMGIYLLMSYRNRRLEVNGEQLTYTTAFGQQTRFRADDIADIIWGVRFHRGETSSEIKDREGRVLARFESNMDSYYLLKIYLDQHMQKKEGD